MIEHQALRHQEEPGTGCVEDVDVFFLAGLQVVERIPDVREAKDVLHDLFEDIGVVDRCCG